jgi:hypothetical protein
VAAPQVSDLAGLLGRTVDTTQGAAVLSIVASLAKSYTRGNGWTEDGPAEDIAAVILTAAARFISHPRQVGIDETKGPESARWLATPVAWSVAELSVLNRYRVRAR